MDNQFIKVLLIDDEIDYCISLSGAARFDNIKIDHTQSLEMGMEKLRDDIGYQFVILDGKCLMTDDQERPKENFVHFAISEIEKLYYEDKRHIPFCVNTGFMDDLSESLDGRVQVFNKEHDNTPLFDYIKKSIEISPISRHKKRHPHLFKAYEEKILTTTHFANVIKILSLLEADEKAAKEHFVLIRETLEAIYVELQKQFDHFPDELFNGIKPNLTSCSYYLSGRKTVDQRSGMDFQPAFTTPDHIAMVLSYLSQVSNDFSHVKYEKYDQYIFISLANALFELIAWLPSYIKQNYNT